LQSSTSLRSRGDPRQYSTTEHDSESLNIEIIPNRGEIILEDPITDPYYLKPEFVGSDVSAYDYLGKLSK
jgi:hypothetical protein